ncbi:hypothetical protein Dimus_036977 [Dionaea muscipula]
MLPLMAAVLSLGPSLGQLSPSPILSDRRLLNYSAQLNGRLRAFSPKWTRVSAPHSLNFSRFWYASLSSFLLFSPLNSSGPWPAAHHMLAFFNGLLLVVAVLVLILCSLGSVCLGMIIF